MVPPRLMVFRIEMSMSDIGGGGCPWRVIHAAPSEGRTHERENGRSAAVSIGDSRDAYHRRCREASQMTTPTAATPRVTPIARGMRSLADHHDFTVARTCPTVAPAT